MASKKATVILFPLLSLFLISGFFNTLRADCTLPKPTIVSTAPFWNNFDVDDNPVSNEFGILHYYTGSKIMAYSSLVHVHLVAGELANVPDGVPFNGTEDFSGSGEFQDLAAGDWQVVFKYVPDGRLGFLNFTVTDDGNPATPDSIEVTRFGLQDPLDMDGIISGDCQSLDNSALPIELEHFSAQVVGETVLLEWTTSAEIDNLGFDIQRSLDGIDFQSIGWEEGQGNSNRMVAYTFIDENVQKNITYYYRLVNRDLQGGGDISPLRSARVKGEGSAVVSPVYPNPVFGANAHLQIVGQQNTRIQLRLFNGMGLLMHQREIELEEGLNQVELSLDQLPSGHYYTLIENEGTTIQRRLMISR